MTPSSPNAAQLRDPVLIGFLRGIEGVRGRIERLILFGSRAKGTQRTDSDYDVAVVVEKRSPEVLDALYESVMDVLLAHGRLVSLKVFERKEFARLQALGTPFMKRIEREGVPIG